MTNFISVLALLTLFACNSHKKVSESNTTLQNASAAQQVAVVDTNYRFSVSFISIGGGTDKVAKQQYDDFIHQFEQQNIIKLSYEITRWGREGEFDYCFKLVELDETKKDVFITESKFVLKNSTLVRFYENVPCRVKRK